MSEFINHTMADIRRGRDSWRVITLFSFSSFAIAIGTALLSHTR